MGKLKTHSGTKDRVKLSKNGKAQHGSSNNNHFKSKQSAARKRRLSGLSTLKSKTIIKNLKLRLGA